VPHPLELQYGLTAEDLLDALSRRFRAKVALEGVVAEVQLEKRLRDLEARQVIARYDAHDLDGYPDFSIWLPGRPEPYRIEVKNVRDALDAYRQQGREVAYKVEVQKTRAAQSDASSRYLAVCLGKKTGNWTDFRFVATSDLQRHRSYPAKLAVMHPVPLPGTAVFAPWHSRLEDLLATL
jgi:hypothetical protein